MEKLKQSISKRPKLMTVKPLMVNPEMVVFAGNQRLRACIALGWKEVPCYVLDWTEEEQREAMIVDNAHNGEWDKICWPMMDGTWRSCKIWECSLIGRSPNPKTNQKN
jgi:hypothetical protein